MGNCIGIAVLEWCKLFGDRKSKHFGWKTVEDEKGFVADLKTQTGITDEQWEKSFLDLRRLRNEFLAHLDNDKDMYVPLMSVPWKATIFYYEYILGEAAGEYFDGLPSDLPRFYFDCYNEAKVKLLDPAR